jgi:hypothetical protein
MTEPLARRMWRALEAYHGFVYFAPEADEEFTAVGLEPGMMGYFASRSAPMGRVGADVVIATFFNFEPGLVRRAIPEAWHRASPAGVLAARLRAADRGLRRMLGDRLDQADIATGATLAYRAAAACPLVGRPLFAGHVELPWPEEPHLALWHGITLLREFRGDGHIATLVAEGVDGCEALVLHAAAGDVPARVLQATRAWSDEQWAATERRLVTRGWLAADGSLTEEGRAHRTRVEAQTDQLATAPWAALTADECEWLRQLGKELSRGILAAGGLRS